MVFFANKPYRHDGCSKEPSYSMAASRKREFYVQRAEAGMVNTVNKTCGHDDCSGQPSCGVAGS